MQVLRFYKLLYHPRAVLFSADTYPRNGFFLLCLCFQNRPELVLYPVAVRPNHCTTFKNISKLMSAFSIAESVRPKTDTTTMRPYCQCCSPNTKNTDFPTVDDSWPQTIAEALDWSPKPQKTDHQPPKTVIQATKGSVWYRLVAPNHLELK